VGKAQRFERRLQGIVGDAFARIFGGSVVPQEVAQALQREADDNARPLAGGRVLAPNRYTVTLGAADHDRLAGDEQRVTRMLKNCIRAHLAEQGWDVYGDVVVALKVSSTLHTGQFRTSSSVDPDTPQPRTAGDGAMSQAMSQPPVDPARAGDAQRNPYRHGGVPAAAPDYGQPAGYAYPGSRYGHVPQDPQSPQSPGASDNYGYYGYDQSGYSQSAQGDYRYGSLDNQQPPYSYRQDRPLSAALILDDGSNRYYQLTEGTMVVGRGHDAQFRLPDTGVSRRHLEITWDGRTAQLADLGSTNGTTVNGTPVQTWQLVDGDVVRVGQSRLVFRTQG
jgi:FHA domain-containing protein